MKKFASLILALVMCMGLTVPAFADEYSDQIFTSQYDYMDTTTLTVDKISGSQSDARIPVGATVTVNAGDAVLGNACTLCISKAYYMNDKLTAVHWSYDPSVGKMVRTDEQECIGHFGCPVLTAGQTYSFVMTQEMADSFAVFDGVDNPNIYLDCGVGLDYGRGITVLFTFDNAAPTQPEQPTAPTQPEQPTAPTQPEQPTAPAAPAFTDVKADAYYASAVKWAVENGITAGTTTTTFSPNATCTTAHILTFMWRAAGSPEPTAASPFTNLNGSEYYAKAAVWAYENGMVSGTTFDASKPCTRAATMEYFWKQAGSPKTNTTDKFTDVASDSAYAEAVAWAVANGVTAGTTETTFSPDRTCTRAQIVTFLNRALVG